MLASVASATLLGVDGHVVTVEVHVSSGLPAFTIVGLPDTIVRESRERVRAALLSSELAWPSHRITVNLCRTHCADRFWRGTHARDSCRDCLIDLIVESRREGVG